MDKFNAIPSEQAGILITALRENKNITIRYLDLEVRLVPQKNIEHCTMLFRHLGQDKSGMVTLKELDALAVVCALFEGLQCTIWVEEKND